MTRELAGVDPRVVKLAAGLRGDDPGRCDVDGIADRLGVDVARRELPLTLWGAMLGSDRVVLNAALSGRRGRFALAHELAHVIVSRGEAPWIAPLVEEPFADAFGRELLVPSCELLHAADVDVARACGEYDVEDRVVLSQMVRVGLQPGGCRSSDGTVICDTCGDIARHPSCRCLILRSVDVLTYSAA